MKPILRRDRRNTSCRISSRIREGITLFPSETSTFVDRLDKLAPSKNKFYYQIPGNRRLKFQKDSRRAHKPPMLQSRHLRLRECREREKEREREESSTDWTSLHRSLLIRWQFYLSINAFESDFSLTIYIFLSDPPLLVKSVR